MSSDIDVVDVIDSESFGLLPPCADPAFDHRSCDYWEDGVQGSKVARSSWWQPPAPPPRPRPRPRADNPFAPEPSDETLFNPFASAGRREGGTTADLFGGDDLDATPDFNPFAPTPVEPPSDLAADVPRKLSLLERGRSVFGSYAKVLLLTGEPAGYIQFGPLSAYPRARQIRELYPSLPQSPLPAVITCVATTASVRDQHLGPILVDAVVTDLAERGFSAIEVYPDRTLRPNEASAATPRFWMGCGFMLAVDDERYPVMRRELS